MTDQLARRQSLMEAYPTARQMADRLIALEDDNVRLGQEAKGLRAEKACQFPEHRHPKFGFVTHLHYMGDMDGMNIVRCVVCNSVHSYPPVAIA